MSTLGAFKGAWEWSFQLESKTIPIHKAGFKMYKRFVQNIFIVQHPHIPLQIAQRICMRLRNTSPEIIRGWDYEKAHIANNPIANIWLVSSIVLGSNWKWIDIEKIAPPPMQTPPNPPSTNNPTTVEEMDLESPNGNETAPSNPYEKTDQPNSIKKGVHWAVPNDPNESKKKKMEFLVTDKVPRPMVSFIQFTSNRKHADKEQGEKGVMEQLKFTLELISESYPSIIFYEFPTPGKIAPTKFLILFPATFDLNYYKPNEQSDSNVNNARRIEDGNERAPRGGAPGRGRGRNSRGGRGQNNRTYKGRSRATTNHLKARPWNTLDDLTKFAPYKPNLKVGKETWIKIFIGHSVPFEEIMTSEVQELMYGNECNLFLIPIQAPESITIGWFSGANASIMDTDRLTKLLQANP